ANDGGSGGKKKNNKKRVQSWTPPDVVCHVGCYDTLVTSGGADFPRRAIKRNAQNCHGRFRIQVMKIDIVITSRIKCLINAKHCRSSTEILLLLFVLEHLK